MQQQEDMTLSEFYVQFIRERITQLRLNKGVSERAMSLALGRGESYIRQITSGKMMPVVSSLIDICEYFGITPVEFFDTGNENPVALRALTEELKRYPAQDLERLSRLMKKLPPDYLHQTLELFRPDDEA